MLRHQMESGAIMSKKLRIVNYEYALIQGFY